MRLLGNFLKICLHEKSSFNRDKNSFSFGWKVLTDKNAA
jgi:hypothetical protein